MILFKLRSIAQSFSYEKIGVKIYFKRMHFGLKEVFQFHFIERRIWWPQLVYIISRILQIHLCRLSVKLVVSICTNNGNIAPNIVARTARYSLYKVSELSFVHNHYPCFIKIVPSNSICKQNIKHYTNWVEKTVYLQMYAII